MATRYSAAVKAEARRLRAAGMSVQQIADALAVRSTSSVQRWVADIPPPDWTRRPNAKDELREAARSLRARGMTYPKIAAELGVSKGSVSLWVGRPAVSSRADVGRRGPLLGRRQQGEGVAAR